MQEVTTYCKYRWWTHILFGTGPGPYFLPN